ncbi:MAG: sugar transferase, partial [Clostridia bacterium]|nr:sugar transferase [Clostridia bacterium]
MYKLFVKRLLDIILVLAALIVALPVMLLVAVAIVIEDPGPVFFTQKRVGKGKRHFKIL